MFRHATFPLVIAFALAASVPAFAEKPNDAGGGKGRGGAAADNGNGNGKNRGGPDKDDDKGRGAKNDKDDDKNRGAKNDKDDKDRGDKRDGPNRDVRFVPSDRDRGEIRTYYRSEYERGDCPPGLAKKNNGCMPPGLAKKQWTRGQPLPPSVIYYELPRALLLRLTPPPSDYQYVRVDNDILLIALGTRLVIDVLGDLGSM